MRKARIKGLELLKQLQEETTQKLASMEKDLELEAHPGANQWSTETVESPSELLEEEEYKANGETFDITFVEFAILNGYFHSVYRKVNPPLTIDFYGYTDSIGRVSFGGSFDVTEGFWFMGQFDGDENDYVFHTKIYKDSHGVLITQLHISVKKGVKLTDLREIFKKIKKLAFNNSIYTGKCIKVKLHEGKFNGIEIIDMVQNTGELILNDTQKKYISSFITRVGRGASTRYLLNGEPGTGKTESIRDIIRKLIPEVTFIIPDFVTNEDLTIILEACEIFDKGVIIIDDIDLYLGSRDHGSYSRLLGQFLSFFDGVKKRKISLLASTNDKGLVDKAAERPGRFNMTLDYTFLTADQIEKVCKIHLPENYHVPEIYEALSERIDGKKANITGAFIANLAENIREMAEDDPNWTLKDTVDLITESYKGFYSSQVDKSSKLGFVTK